MNTTIADFPAYRIYKPYAGRRFKHGEVIAVPYQSRNYGQLWAFYTLGTVAGFAIAMGEDPFPAVERATKSGHKLYWANQNYVSLTAWGQPKEEHPGFEIGDEIILQGHTFRIERAPNNNIELVEVTEDFEPANQHAQDGFVPD